MDYSNNFKTALKEIIGIDEPKENRPPKENITLTANQGVKNLNLMEEGTAEKKNTDFLRKEPVPVQSESSVISVDTKIIGKIVSNGHIYMNGEVEGDIKASGNIIINGMVKGNLNGKNIELKTGSITGDITAAGSITIENGTEITGSLDAETVTIDGKLNGDINSKGETVLKKNSLVSGNLTTGSIAIEKGSLLCGQVAMQASAKAAKTEKQDCTEKKIS